METLSKDVLEVRGITRSFGTGATRQLILKETNLAIAAGELTLLMGPSGAGKSTLLAILGGLLQPDRGEVFAFGKHLWPLSASEIARFRLRHCGFIFQGFNLFPALTALEQVILPLRYAGLKKREARDRAHEALCDVGLANQLQLRPQELSGGEKQRVAIARAMAKRPELLFADEPTSALDGANGQNVIMQLHRIAREHGTMVLCVTHDPRLTVHGDRVLTIEDGRISRDFRQQHPVAVEKDHDEVRLSA